MGAAVLHTISLAVLIVKVESDIKKVCLAMLEAAQREYSLEALDRKIVFGFFELLADEYVAGLKEYANNTIA